MYTGKNNDAVAHIEPSPGVLENFLNLHPPSSGKWKQISNLCIQEHGRPLSERAVLPSFGADSNAQILCALLSRMHGRAHC